MNGTRVRFNWPLVVLVLGLVSIVSAVWLTLVLTHNVSVSSLQTLAGWVVGILCGGSVPIVSWFKEKRLDFELTSDPPPPDRKGSENAAS